MFGDVAFGVSITVAHERASIAILILLEEISCTMRSQKNARPF
jgi:hypothetical protein